MKLIVKLVFWIALTLFLAKRSEKFEEFLRAPVLIVQCTSTTIELCNIQKLLVLHRTASGTDLLPTGFAGFIGERIKSKNKKCNPRYDCWKRPYY